MDKWCALISLAAGIVLAFVALILAPVGVIDTSAVWVIAQLLIYSAGLFGVRIAARDLLRKN